MALTNDQKKLKELIDRRHPEYEQYVGHWDFLEASYEGGREWFQGNIFQYMKEGDEEYQARLQRAYRFNHTRECVDLVNKYIFRSQVIRNEKDAPDIVRKFWRQATRTRQPIDTFMRHVSTKTSIFGRIWMVVDSNNTGEARTRADEKKLDLRVYAYAVRPQDVLDLSVDGDGELNWILLREIHRDDADPVNSSGAVNYRYRLWTRNEWYLLEAKKEQNKKVKVVLVDWDEHRLGEVPVFPVDHVPSDKLYKAPALIEDIAYLDRAVANYLSNLDAIIQDQTFSQLAIPAQGLMPGEDGYNKMLEMGTKRIFVYNGDGGVKPEFISPDPRQAQLIVAVINKIINEIYHTVGMAGERTKQDNAVGIDNSSGVAKAYDFERMNALLTSKADALDQAENKLIRYVRLWHGEKPEENPKDLVKYPDSYDVRGLYDEFEIATQLALIEAPDAVRQEQMKTVIDKLFPRLAEDLKSKMLSELKSWPPEPDPVAPKPNLSAAVRQQNKAPGQGAPA